VDPTLGEQVENVAKLGSALVGMTVLVALATPAAADPTAPRSDTGVSVGGPAPTTPRYVGPGGELESSTPSAPPRAIDLEGGPHPFGEQTPVLPGKWEHAGPRYLPGVPEGFSRGPDGLVLHTFATDAGWTPWTPIGHLPVAGTPSGVHRPASRSTEVFARGVDGRLVHAGNTGEGWSEWSVIGDRQLAGDPLAVHQPNTGTTEVFARGADGRLIHTDDSAGEWSAWTTIGDWTVTGPLTPVKDPHTGTTEVLARTTDDHVVRVENAAGGWAIWSVS
jgi:hypothetical protein